MTSSEPVPMKCLVCETEGSYYGRLCWPQEPGEPTCPNHKDAEGNLIGILLSPVDG